MDKIIAVLLAGIVGYFTNFLAIKMLFRPLREIKIGKFKLPFTPGIIPKNRKRIQESLSKTIQDKLLNKDDIINQIVENISNEKNSSKIDEFLKENSISNLLLKYIEEEKINSVQESIKISITQMIIKKYYYDDMGDIIADKLLNGLTNNMGMLKSLLGGLKPTIKGKIDEFVDSELEGILKDIIQNQIDIFKEKKLDEFEIVKIAINSFLIKIVEKGLNIVLEKLDIEQMIYQKIDALNLLEFEHLLLGIIKKELRMITYLGGIIGILIGLINIFL